MAPVIFGQALAIQRVHSVGRVFRLPTSPQWRSIAFASTAAPRVAVLYQAIDPPVINGVTKPRKPGGGSCPMPH
jgi:hypothetical protein